MDVGVDSVQDLAHGETYELSQKMGLASLEQRLSVYHFKHLYIGVGVALNIIPFLPYFWLWTRPNDTIGEYVIPYLMNIAGIGLIAYGLKLHYDTRQVRSEVI